MCMNKMRWKGHLYPFCVFIKYSEILECCFAMFKWTHLLCKSLQDQITFSLFWWFLSFSPLSTPVPFLLFIFILHRSNRTVPSSFPSSSSASLFTELLGHHRPKASQTSRQATDAIHAVQPEGKQEGKTPIHGVCFYCLSSPTLKRLQGFEGWKQPSHDASPPH